MSKRQASDSNDDCQELDAPSTIKKANTLDSGRDSGPAQSSHTGSESVHVTESTNLEENSTEVDNSSTTRKAKSLDSGLAQSSHTGSDAVHVTESTNLEENSTEVDESSTTRKVNLLSFDPPQPQSARSTSTDLFTESKKVSLIQQQLKSYQHIMNCKDETHPSQAHCENIYCKHFKKILVHISSCIKDDCKEEHCVTLRRIVRHWEKCKDDDCIFCRDKQPTSTVGPQASLLDYKEAYSAIARDMPSSSTATDNSFADACTNDLELTSATPVQVTHQDWRNTVTTEYRYNFLRSCFQRSNETHIQFLIQIMQLMEMLAYENARTLQEYNSFTIESIHIVLAIVLTRLPERQD